LDKLDILTIGLPFAGFKILVGIVLRTISGEVSSPMGWILIVWGIADLLINLLNLVGLVLKKKKIVPTCAMGFIFQSSSEEVGSALDVMMSFTLVAIMVGGNLLKHLTPFQLNIWSLSVVLNVLGAGISRIKMAIENIRKQETSAKKGDEQRLE
jgi:hypothetical protein